MVGFGTLFCSGQGLVPCIIYGLVDPLWYAILRYTGALPGLDMASLIFESSIPHISQTFSFNRVLALLKEVFSAPSAAPV